MLWGAFILGMIGSMHCAGMCGPIALALRSNSSSSTSFVIHRIAYNLGRVLTYSLIGALIGGIGAMISFAGLQQLLSITLGIALLLVAASFLPFLKFSSLKILSPLTQWVTIKLSFFIRSGKSVDMVIIGMLNGLLPCGLVYTALAAAAATGSIWSGMTFMGLFGLGTLPAMFSISLSGKLIPVAWRHRLTQLYPYITFMIGVLLVLRGLGLGIPFVSPDLAAGTAGCSMCHK